MRAWLIVALLSLPLAGRAAEGPQVLALAYPSRDANVLAEAQAIAKDLIQQWHGVPALPRAKSSELSARLARARVLALQGDMDQAASIYDAALEDGAHALDTIPDPAEFVTAHVARASIALARGERERAGALMTRVRSFDGAFSLAPNERSPQMRALFDASTPNATADKEAWSGACRSADVLLVARRLASGFEVTRFDHCTVVNLHAAKPATLGAPRSFDRTKLAAGITTLGVGLALAIAGAVYTAQAVSQYHEINHDCSPTMTCPAESLRSRNDGYRDSTTLAGTLGGLGIAALVGGSVVLYYGLHPRRSEQ